MEKLHLVIDLAKCVGCFNCMMACKDEHVDNKWLPYTDEQQKHDQKWILTDKHERGRVPFTDMCFVTRLCQHCGDAPCENARPDAVYRRRDGIVLLDAQKSKGDKSLADACPYGMISWNDELGAAQKCTMCAHLIDDGWKEPRCVQACPLRAMSVVLCEDSEFEKLIEDWKLKPLTDGSNSPRVMYRNMYKYTTCFIAGALAFKEEGGTERAAAGAVVKLKMNGEPLTEVTTDFFGEFKIDRVPKNSGTFELICDMDGYKRIEKTVDVGEESLCLTVMYFEKN